MHLLFYDWEQRKLGEVFEQTSEYINPMEANLELFSLTIEKGLTQKTERYNRSFLVKKEDKFKKVNPNDFVYNPMNMTLGAVGFSELGYSVAISGYYITMKTTVNWSNQYFRIWLSSPHALHLYKLYATGSLIEKQRVQLPNFSQIKMRVPYFEEQKKIGDFFKQIDDTIALYQQKLDKLKGLKSAYSDQIFSQRIRFLGFSGVWEQRKLGEILKINSGRDYKHLQQGNIPVYGTGGYMLSVNDRLSDEDAIGIGRKGTIDNPQLLKAPFWTVDTLFYMTIKEKSNLLFYYSLANKINWKQYDESTGVPSLSKSSIEKISISIPTLEEQSKIGNFFKQLDHNITLYQSKVEKLIKIKQGFLQKMFI